MKHFGLIFLLVYVFSFNSDAQNFIIKGEILNSKIDSVRIALQGNGIDKKTISKKLPVINGKYYSNFKISSPTYFYITDEINYIGGLADQGDDITISYDFDNLNNTLKFEGKGSERVSLSNRLNQLKLHKLLQKQLPNASLSTYPFDYLFNYIDSIGYVLFSDLNSIKKQITSKSYIFLEADIKSMLIANKYRSIGLLYHEGIDETLLKRKNQLTNSSFLFIKNILKFDSTLFISPSYTSEVFNILNSYYGNLLFQKQVKSGISLKYKFINEHLPKSLRKPVLAQFIQNDLYNIKNDDDINELRIVIRNTYTRISDSLYRNNFEKILDDLSSIKNGINAPIFELENENGDKVTLSSFEGKVLIMDFWYAACGPCHLLFNELKPLKKLYENNPNVIFLCISTDSKDIWLKSLKKYNISGLHLFTQNLEMKHPIINSYKIIGYPTLYIIGKDGKIFSANPSKNIGELQKEIESALMSKKI